MPDLASLLGVVHSTVRRRQKGRHAVPVLGKGCNTDTGRHRIVGQFRDERRGERFLDAPDERGKIGRLLGVHHRCDELITTEARDEIGCPECEA